MTDEAPARALGAGVFSLVAPAGSSGSRTSGAKNIHAKAQRRKDAKEEAREEAATGESTEGAVI